MAAKGHGSDENVLYHVCMGATHPHSLVKSHGIVHLNLVNVTVWKLCLKKAYLFKKWTQTQETTSKSGELRTDIH